MELGRIKDQINATLDKMDAVDPTSEEYEVLTKRLNELRRIIQDEEQRRATEKLESEKNQISAANSEAELAERKKDRWVKIGLGVGAGFIGIASIFADETRVACKSGLETIDKMRKIVH
jgi:hypothetical protein